MSLQADNKEDIALAYRTLVFLGQFTDEQIPLNLRPKMRDVVANICDFQSRFASPLELPLSFGGNFDMNVILPTPRPLDVLLRFGYAYPVEGNDGSTSGQMEQDDGITQGKHFCFAGKKTWTALVQKGILTNNAAIPPDTTSWNWFKHLFDLFASTVQLSPEIQDIARRLAACWYHVATQIDFGSTGDEEEDENLDIGATSSLLSLLAGANLGYHSDEDGDFDPKKVEDEEDDDEFESEEDQEDQDMETDQETKETVEKTPEESPEKGEKPDEELANAIQQTILQTIDLLKAYMPSPESDMIWFKRTLKSMSGKSVGDESWFPWGVPPMQCLVNCSKSEDKNIRDYATKILNLFQPQEQ